MRLVNKQTGVRISVPDGFADRLDGSWQPVQVAKKAPAKRETEKKAPAKRVTAKK